MHFVKGKGVASCSGEKNQQADTSYLKKKHELLQIHVEKSKKIDWFAKSKLVCLSEDMLINMFTKCQQAEIASCDQNLQNIKNKKRK